MTQDLLLPRSSPAKQGVDPSSISKLIDAFASDGHEMHSIMIIRHGHVISSGWWTPYRANVPHMMFSLSKSFTSTAAGFAVAEGLISVDDKVLSFFPDQSPESPSSNLAALRVGDLLTMTAGGGIIPMASECKDVEDWAAAFLSKPFEDEPGTKFVYNNGATYMVSAIIQKVTGQRVEDYLKPRLFEPLGIASRYWELCPSGITTGGWGLYAITETIAKFGLTYLNGGVFGDKQVIPAAWVAEATSRQVATYDDTNQDWGLGYGYQFWRCQHGAFRGDGMFGQFCVVIPSLDMVVATTAATWNMAGVLNLIWEHLLPSVSNEVLEDEAAEASLGSKLASLALKIPDGESSSKCEDEVFGRTFAFPRNDEAIESILAQADGDEITITLTADSEEHLFRAGRVVWIDGTTPLIFRAQEPFNKLDTYLISSAAAWSGNCLTVRVAYIETPFSIYLKLAFDGDTATLDVSSSMPFNEVKRAPLVGVAAG